MILEYAEYQALGGTAEEADFAMLEARAANRITQLTHGRLKDETPVRECVKMAAFALIRAMQMQDAGGRTAQAMSNDGVSVKYAETDVRMQYAQIVREYLDTEVSADGTGLMYAGVDA